jgi:hypothetical protein
MSGPFQSVPAGLVVEDEGRRSTERRRYMDATLINSHPFNIEDQKGSRLNDRVRIGWVNMAWEGEKN